MHRLRVVNIPPIRARRADVPGILNALFAQPPLSSHLEVAALGADTVERLQEFDWPGNFKDLRNAAPRVLAYIETNRNLRAAAEKVGRKHQSLGEALRRIGVIT